MLVPPDLAWLGSGFKVVCGVALARVAERIVVLLMGADIELIMVETLAVNTFRIAEMMSGVEVG